MYKADGNRPPKINKSCTNDTSPSETNEKCKEFERIMGKGKMPKSGEAIVIVYDTTTNKRTKCYGPSRTNAGWCGTCSLDAKAGSISRLRELY